MGEKFWQRILGRGKEGGPQKSTLFLLALAVAGIVLMLISANPELGSPAPEAPPQESTQVLAPGGRADYRERLERELAEKLRRVRGVDDVSVLVTLESGPVYEFATDSQTTGRSTHEADGAGGLRDVAETTVSTQTVITRNSSGEEAVVAREIQPKIAGVMVVARGAGNPAVLEQITQAVAAALNLPAHRIRVLPME